jgi:nicotinate-nucleotide adenylyltransferase
MAGEVDVAEIGILGGTFDPIHYGHLIIAEAARDQLRLDWVEFVPANDPPHKPDDAVSPVADRVAMVRLAIADISYFHLNCVEVEREGPSYTVETLETLTSARPGDTFHFIIGGDSLRDFKTWRSPNRIAHLARLAVIERPGAEYDLHALERALPDVQDRIDFVRAPLIDLSATGMRSRYAAGQSIRFQTPDPVIAYIERAGLYPRIESHD